MKEESRVVETTAVAPDTFSTAFSLVQRERWYQRLKNWVWGYDFFISYHWASGGTYAVNLAAKLREKGYDVFLDRAEYAMGDKWKGVGEIALRNTQRLILIATREAVFESKPVEHEVVKFTDCGRHFIPIFFGDTFAAEEQANSGKFIVLDRLPDDALYIKDLLENLPIGPAPDVVDKLAAAHGIMRRRKLRQTITLVALSLLTTFAIVAAISAVRAGISLVEAVKQEKIATGEKIKADQANDNAQRLVADISLQNGHRAINSDEDIGAGLLWYSQALQTTGESSASARGSAALLIGGWSKSLPREVLAHDTGVMTMASNRDGSTLVIGLGHTGRFLSQGDAQIWDISRGTSRTTTMEEESWVTAVAFNTRGDRLATACSNTVTLWDSSWNRIWERTLDVAGCWSLAFSQDGHTLAAAGGDPSFDASARGTVSVWDVGTGESKLEESLQHDGMVWVVAFNPKNNQSLISTSADGKVRIWDMQSRTPYAKALTFDGDVRLLAICEEGRNLAVATLDGTVTLFDVDSDKQRGPGLSHSAGVLAMTFSADGSVLMTADRTEVVRLWDAKDGTLLSRRDYSRGRTTPVATLSPGGEQLITVDIGRKALVWSLAPIDIGGVRLNHAGESLDSLSFSLSGRRLFTASAGRKGTVFEWDVKTGRCRREFDHNEGVLATRFSDDGRLFATASKDGAPNRWAIQVWDVTSAERIGTRLTGAGTVSNLAFSIDGKGLLVVTQVRNPLLAEPTLVPTTASEERALTHIYLLDFRTGQSQTWPWNMDKERFGKGESWDLVQFSIDGSFFTTVDTFEIDANIHDDENKWQSIITLRDAKTGQGGRVSPKLDELVTAVAWSPDGRMLATTSWNPKSRHGAIRLWDSKSWQPMSAPLSHDSIVNAVSFAPNGRILASASSNGTVRLWDTFSGRLLGEPITYGGAAKAIAFSPDSTTLAVGCGDNVWLRPVPIPVANDHDRLRLSVEIRSERTIENGLERPLTRDEWLERKQKLDGLGGDCLDRTWDDLSDIERAELRSPLHAN